MILLKVFLSREEEIQAKRIWARTPRVQRRAEVWVQNEMGASGEFVGVVSTTDQPEITVADHHQNIVIFTLCCK